SAEEFEAVLADEGKSAENNLRGFRAGVAAARNGAAVPADGKRGASEHAALRSMEAILAAVPNAGRDLATEGVRRLIHYQDTNYARLYLERLQPVAEADAVAGADGKLLAAVAQHLAVRMSYEDVIRVAQVKIDPARMRRIAEEMKIGGDPFAVYEFLKPGVEEF